jgi:RHS repeat-associated protein
MSNYLCASKYLWGLDLTGSLDGAGGVGGSLAVNGVGNGVHFCAMDGNGNIGALVKATDGTISAAYEYDPFGKTIRATSAMAQENSLRFSTKRADDATDLALYEYRSYSPASGRWLSRDPTGERGLRVLNATSPKAENKHELQLYLFVGNSSIYYWDYLGLDNPGCDIPVSIANSLPGDPYCYLRCCAKHDECYYKRDCTASSWLANALQAGASLCGKYAKILSCGLIFHPCVQCNNTVAACFAKCTCGFPSSGPRWFCPNGDEIPPAGTFYDDWCKIPPSCWESGIKPNPPPGIVCL